MSDSASVMDLSPRNIVEMRRMCPCGNVAALIVDGNDPLERAMRFEQMLRAQGWGKAPIARKRVAPGVWVPFPNPNDICVCSQRCAAETLAHWDATRTDRYMFWLKANGIDVERLGDSEPEIAQLDETKQKIARLCVLWLLDHPTGEEA